MNGENMVTALLWGASLLPVQYARSGFWTLERRAAKPLNLAPLERRCTRFSWKSSLCSIG